MNKPLEQLLAAYPARKAEEYVCQPIEYKFDTQPTSITIESRKAFQAGYKTGEAVGVLKGMIQALGAHDCDCIRRKRYSISAAEAQLRALLEEGGERKEQ